MSKYRIHTVAQVTGLSAALIRAWEARYGLVVPVRTPAGYRLYSDEDIAVLRGAQRLSMQGVAPMQMATMGRAALLAAARDLPPLKVDAPAHREPPSRVRRPATVDVGPSAQDDASAEAEADEEAAARRAPPREEPLRRPSHWEQPPRPSVIEPAQDDLRRASLPPRMPGAAPKDPPRRDAAVAAAFPPGSSALLFGERIDHLIDAFQRFDTARAEQLLGPPLALLPAEVVCEHLLLPLLREVGERWHQGTMAIAAEHFGTSLVRTKLLALLDSLRGKTGPRRVVCACLPGELHEIGLMMFALLVAGQGWDPVYLGANVPAFDLLDAVTRTQAELLGLSVVQRLPSEDLRQRLYEIRALLAGRAEVVVGGRGVVGQREVIQQAGCLVLPASGRLDELPFPPR